MNNTKKWRSRGHRNRPLSDEVVLRCLARNPQGLSSVEIEDKLRGHRAFQVLQDLAAAGKVVRVPETGPSTPRSPVTWLLSTEQNRPAK